MNLNEDHELAAAIDRELKHLPELQAPATLMSRVLSTLERPVLPPWYRRAWQTWPAPLQAAGMAVLLVFLAALCLGTWKLTQSASLARALHTAATQFSGLTALWAAVNAICGVFVLAVKQLNTTILIAACAAMALAWAMCLGLGTVCVRLALARR